MTVLCVFPVFLVFLHILETPNRRGMQFHAEKWSNFALSSHIDPIGDRNDVWYVGALSSISMCPHPIVVTVAAITLQECKRGWALYLYKMPRLSFICPQIYVMLRKLVLLLPTAYAL